MSHHLIECPDCFREQPSDRYNLEVSDACFRCRTQSLRFSFGPGGKDFFHNVTNKEWADENISKGRANGLDVVPVGKGTYAGPAKMPTPSVVTGVAVASSNGAGA